MSKEIKELVRISEARKCESFQYGSSLLVCIFISWKIALTIFIKTKSQNYIKIYVSIVTNGDMEEKREMMVIVSATT